MDHAKDHPGRPHHRAAADNTPTDAIAGQDGPLLQRRLAETINQSPRAIAQRAQIDGLQEAAASAERSQPASGTLHAASPVAQRMLKHGTKQFASMRELSLDAVAYNLYSTASPKLKETLSECLKDKENVYDMTGTKLEAEIPKEVEAPKELEKVKMSSLTGPSLDQIRKETDETEMARIESIVAAAAVSFGGERVHVHLIDAGDGTAGLQDTDAIEAIVQGAKAARMSSAGVGKRGGKNIRITYGDPGLKLSVILEFDEAKKTAVVFHAGPGG